MSEKPLKKKSAMPIQLQTRQPRVTDAEKEERIKVIIEQISQGNTGVDLLRYIAARYNNMPERTCEYYIKMAKDRLIAANSETVQEAAAMISANYWQIVRETQKAKEYSTSVSALRELGKIKGLDQQTVNHNINIQEIEKLDDDFIEGELANDPKDEQ